MASADVTSGDLKIEITGRGDPAPGTDVALVQEGYVSVTPLMSIVRAPVKGAAQAIAACFDDDRSRRSPEFPIGREKRRVVCEASHPCPRPRSSRMPAVGDLAPDFTLKDQNGNDVTPLRTAGEPSGHRVLPVHLHRGLPGRAVRDPRRSLGVRARRRAGAGDLLRLAPLADAVWAEEQGFTFPVLSDFWPHGAVAKEYGVFNDALGCANRASFVLDKDGVVSSTFSSPDLGTLAPRPSTSRHSPR